MNSYKYVLATLIAVTFTWTLHEFSHWITGELLSNDMIMTLNTCYSKSGQYIKNWHSIVISAAGPVVTIIQAFVFYYLLKFRSDKSLFPFLLTCLYMRLLAGIMNLINPNDEGKTSLDMGLGTFTLSILVVGILFYLTYDISKIRGFKTKLITTTTLLIILFSSIIILTDQTLKVIILR
jgi:hypothetical protein